MVAEKGSTPLKWANDKAAPKLAHSHAPALVCLLLVQRPADTKAITTDFDPNGILRAHTNVHARTHTHTLLQSHTHPQACTHLKQEEERDRTRRGRQETASLL